MLSEHMLKKETISHMLGYSLEYDSLIIFSTDIWSIFSEISSLLVVAYLFNVCYVTQI